MVEINESVEKNSTSELSNRTLLKENSLFRHFQTRDEKLLKLLETAQTVVPTKIPVLITGEYGAGKETLAKAIHIAGGRERGRFIVANSTNIPDNFFELELFPKQKNQNEYETTNSSFGNSSLMLSEVTELESAMQFKLLRLLKDQESDSPFFQTGTATDARIIGCSYKNIQDEVNAHRFNSDLFYKMQVIHLAIPPLRQRLPDIDLYSEIFLREFNTQFSKNVQLSQMARQSLHAYTWPGNVRELRNVIQRSVLLANKDYIGAEELHLMRTNNRTAIAMGEPLPQITMAALEQRLILQTLRRMDGNRTHTAKALGISLRALRYKLNELVECGYEVEGKNA